MLSVLSWCSDGRALIHHSSELLQPSERFVKKQPGFSNVDTVGCSKAIGESSSSTDGQNVEFDCGEYGKAEAGQGKAPHRTTHGETYHQPGD